MDLPLCTCLACHIIRSISVMVTRTGHIRGLPQIYYIWVTSQWRHSYLAHWRFTLSISFHLSMCHYHGSVIIMLSQHCIGISYYLGCPTALGLVQKAAQGANYPLHKQQKYYHQALRCPLRIVYMTPLHSPPLPSQPIVLIYLPASCPTLGPSISTHERVLGSWDSSCDILIFFFYFSSTTIFLFSGIPWS